MPGLGLITYPDIKPKKMPKIKKEKKEQIKIDGGILKCACGSDDLQFLGGKSDPNSDHRYLEFRCRTCGNYFFLD